ncbi:prostaglandin reductase-3 [Tachysurus fulvidraco]|uniref:prostaglandin reductase-3 n=1 Tax=Tachysurus fulvidraco TaxID=1234273 RepID=UPI000F50259D|nr:prostaglandin reductase-3 [Tachysurus fulvidraco]
MSVSLMCKSVLGSRRALHAFQRRFIIDMSYSNHFMDYKRSSIPSSMKKMMVMKLSPNFRQAVSVETLPVPTPRSNELLIRNRYIGINASDINYSAGRYDPSLTLPFPVGFEGVGEVVALGLSASSRFTVGDTVAYLNAGAFAEYTLVSAQKVIPLKEPQPEALAVIVSGATASIALKCLGEIKQGEKVLVTAAAGGTGHFAVQFAKMAGCHVIGTCSTREKAEFLKSIGCDRPINYKEEDLAATLRREYPKGVDVVYESIGGAVFDLAVNNLAQHGRLLVVGFISGYQSKSGLQPISGDTIPAKLLQKSASIRGFFLAHFLSEYSECVQKIIQMQEKGEILCAIDNGQMEKEGRFVGLESVYRAIDYMYAGKNQGKVVVEVNPDI